MKIPLALTLACIAAPALAQHEGHAMPQADPHAGHAMPMEADAAPPADPDAMDSGPMDHGDMDHGAMDHAAPMAARPPQSAPPPEALSGPEHAADLIFPDGAMDASRDALRRNQGGASHAFFGFDRLEAQIAGGEDGYLWDANAWVGGDIDKLWTKSEGEGAFGGDLEEAEFQALWSHAIGPYFDLQLGARYDLRPRPDRAHLVAGIQGLAPYFFEIDAAAFLSDEGELTARVEVEYDQRLTQRLILQPRIEANLAAQDIAALGIGGGLGTIEAGLRLRYEIIREFAPYIGVSWQRDIGGTADFTRAAGGDPDRLAFIAGVKVWF